MIVCPKKSRTRPSDFSRRATPAAWNGTPCFGAPRGHPFNSNRKQLFRNGEKSMVDQPSRVRRGIRRPKIFRPGVRYFAKHRPRAGARSISKYRRTFIQEERDVRQGGVCRGDGLSSPSRGRAGPIWRARIAKGRRADQKSGEKFADLLVGHAVQCNARGERSQSAQGKSWGLPGDLDPNIRRARLTSKASEDISRSAYLFSDRSQTRIVEGNPIASVLRSAPKLGEPKCITAKATNGKGQRRETRTGSGSTSELDPARDSA